MVGRAGPFRTSGGEAARFRWRSREVAAHSAERGQAHLPDLEIFELE